MLPRDKPSDAAAGSKRALPMSNPSGLHHRGLDARCSREAPASGVGHGQLRVVDQRQEVPWNSIAMTAPGRSSHGAPDLAPKSSERPTVFVVDDDESVRETLQLFIGAAGWQVEAFESGKDFLSRPRASGPSCLVLDVGLPDLSGLDLQQALQREQADLPIIFVTGRGDVPTSVRAMKAGAVEFLTKPCDDEALCEAIRQALDRSRAAIDREQAIHGLRGCYALLTAREREVLALVVSGLSNKQVGNELGITEITVKVHRGRVMRKMQADSLVGLVQMVDRLRLTSHRNP